VFRKTQNAGHEIAFMSKTGHIFASCSENSKIMDNQSTVFDRNIPYNQLPLLPPPSESIDGDVLIKWGLVNRALAELSRNILRLPDPNMLVNTISLREAKTSTAIENIFTTDDDLYKAISDRISEQNANPATKEVLRYREALWEGYNHVRERGSIDLDLFISVYRNVKASTQGIRPPQSLVNIKRGNSEFRSGEVVYTPPRGEDVLEAKLSNLIDFLNNDADFHIDPLLKMIIAHYQFEAIHPFTDGNGRVGRIINLLYLTNRGLLSQPVLYLSSYIIEHKDTYYHRLAGVTQRRAWKDWMMFMLDAVGHTAINTNRLIDEILLQAEATYLHCKQKTKWYSKEINEALFTQPYIKPAYLGEVLGRSSRTTLYKYLDELVSLQVLSPKQDGKQVFYINTELIRILES
jgi:Fic family protein